MTIHEVLNSIIFLNFKTSLVKVSNPLRVIMTHCIQKIICESPLNFLKNTQNIANFRKNVFVKNEGKVKIHLEIDRMTLYLLLPKFRFTDEILIWQICSFKQGP